MGFQLDAKTRMLLAQQTLDATTGLRTGEPRKVIALPIGEVRSDRLATLRRRGDALPPYRPTRKSMRPGRGGGDDAA